MKSFEFGGVTFTVSADHFNGYVSLASYAEYEETVCGGIDYAATFAREDDCPWES